MSGRCNAYKPTGTQTYSCLPEGSLGRSREGENCSTWRGLQQEDII